MCVCDDRLLYSVVQRCAVRRTAEQPMVHTACSVMHASAIVRVQRHEWYVDAYSVRCRVGERDTTLLHWLEQCLR